METLSDTERGVEAKSEEDRQALSQIRAILQSANQQSIDEAISRINALQRKLEDPVERSKDMHEVIVPVVREQLTHEHGLRDVLKPVWVEQFHKTAREEPDVMAEALFPILGPAVRKMIANLISPDKKTRKRVYKVEQLLLIDKESSLPLCQVTSDAAFSQDADMVSGMLSAIQSFVHDAFAAEEFDGLNTLQVGELAVWIEWGPSAVLAAVVRGSPTQNLRTAMQIYLEQLHVGHGELIDNYNGEIEKVDFLKSDLTKLLDNHDGSLKNQFKNAPPFNRRVAIVAATTLVCLLGWYIYDTNDAKKWDRYILSLDAVPGVVVLNHERSFREYKLVALKDPSVNVPIGLLTDARLKPQYVVQQFEAYQALDASLVLERVKALLSPPAGGEFRLVDSVLQISGDIDSQWLEDARQKLRFVSGVDRVVFSGK